MNTEMQLSNPGQSPFDAIMRQRSDGTSYWAAREMMPYLGYTKWERMRDTIERAKQACANSDHDPDDHFASVTSILPGVGKNSNSGGRPGLDYHLSRFACYLTAMNGDPTKNEVAAAQRYFAVMTRAAEMQVTTPAPVELSPLEQARLWVKALEHQEEQKKQLALVEAKTAVIEAKADEAVAKADHALALANRDPEFMTIVGFCRIHGMKLSNREKAAAGGRLTRACKAAGISIHVVFDEHFGSLNLYPLEVLEQWHASFQPLLRSGLLARRS